MKQFITLTKDTLKETYYLVLEHGKKTASLAIGHIVIFTIISVIISFLIVSIYNAVSSRFDVEFLELSIIDIELNHITEISTNIFVYTTLLFSIFLLKYKSSLAKTKLSHTLQFKDTKIYGNWFMGLLLLILIEFLLYNDLLETGNDYYWSGSGPIFFEDSLPTMIKFKSWFNSLTNFIQTMIPSILAVIVISFSIASNFKLKEIKKIIIPILSTVFLIYTFSTLYYSFMYDIDTYVFTLFRIPFEFPWIFIVLKIAFSLFIISIFYVFTAAAIAFPISKFLNADITARADKIAIEDNEILDNQ